MGQVGRWWRPVVEAGAGVVVLVVVALVAWPGRPAPVDAASAWSQRVAPVENALALDVAFAAGQPALKAGMAGRLAHDLARAERTGPPPDRPRAEVWAKALGRVRTALTQAQGDPQEARATLELAALELSGLSAAQAPARSGAQPQASGAGGPKPAAAG